jgi:hypothetical protein
MWCKLAVGNGFRDCEKTLGYLGSKMTAEQIAEAEQKAQVWRAAHPQNKATLP